MKTRHLIHAAILLSAFSLQSFRLFSQTTITGTTIRDNNVTGNGGGGISTSANGAIFNLNNVSFINNRASGFGGAIAVTGAGSSSATFNINVGAGLTSRFAGNTDSTGRNSIYVNYTGASQATFNLFVDAGGVLDMLDPIKAINNASNNSGARFNKTGDGIWKLAGSSTFTKYGNTGANTTEINVNQGMLYLYGAKDAPVVDSVSGSTYTPAAATIEMLNGYASNGNAGLYFTLAQSATLGIGGGNSIAYTTISAGNLGNAIFTMNAGSILDFKLDNATAGAAAPAMLTIDTHLLSAANSTIITGGTLNPYIHLTYADITPLLGNTYNLLTLITNTTANLATITDYLSILDNATFGGLTYAQLNAALYDANFGVTSDGLTLYVELDRLATESNILTWTGAANDTLWKGSNWALASDASPAKFTNGDIVNLALAPATSATINANVAITTSGMYVSGNADYTITGASPIIVDGTAAIKDNLAGVDAANGKLTLGAKANADGTITASTYAGTLTLANTAGGAPNTFTNGIDINSGQLVGNAASLNVGASATVTIASTGTLTLNQTADAGDATYAAPIANATGATTGGALNKTGDATLTLAADSTAFTGLTNLNAGALNLLSTAKLGGALNVNASTLLAVAGGARIGGNLAVAGSGTLRIGLDSTPGQALTIGGNLSLGNGTLLDYTDINNQLLVLGSVSQTGATTLNISATSSGIYNLIDAQGGWGAIVNTNWLTVNYQGTLLAPTAYTLNIVGNDLQLFFAATGLNRVAVWNGSAGPAWEAAGNWTAFDGPKTFAAGDIVNLTNAGGTTSVSSAPVSIALASAPTVAAMYVSGTASYALTGAGIVANSSAGDLAATNAATNKLALGRNAPNADIVATTAFTGTLDMTGITANTFTGGVDIYSGVFRIATPDQLGTPLSGLTFAGSSTGVPATLQIAAGKTVTFDSSLTGVENHLAISASAAASFVVEDGATLTFSNNTATSNGGAISVAAGASLTITNKAGAQTTFSNNNTTTAAGAIYLTNGATLTLNGGGFLFDSNTTNNQGGAIFAQTNVTVIIDSATFSNNIDGASTTSNGAAIAALGSSTLTLSNVLFATNTTGYIGGAIFNNSNTRTTVLSSTFAGNHANNGGAIGTQNASGTNTITLRDVSFTGNGANVNGGAIMLQSNNTYLDATRALFDSNTAGANGGAFSINVNTAGNRSSATFTDATFTNNAANANGGAIYTSTLGAIALALNVSDGATSLFSGNTSGTGANLAPNSIYFAGASATTTLTVNAGSGATLDMLDPMTAADGLLAITKTGAGAWNLGGANNLGAAAAANITFAVNAGALHLYRAGETDTTGTHTAATGNLTLAGPSSSFTLGSAATLSAGGGNTITANKITLADNATITLDLTGALAGPANSVLTLNTTTLASNWTQTLTLLNLATLTPAEEDTFNLITLTGGNTSLFTDIGTFANVFGLTTGYQLQLSDDDTILQLFYSSAISGNNVLTWTGALDGTWTGATNWKTATASGTKFARGDIINLDSTNTANDTITLNNAATINSMYVSGTSSYTLIGAGITANAAVGTLATDPAAAGQLILGARATDDASDINTAAYSGTLTLANTANNFTGGILIRTGALTGNAATLGSGTVGIENHGTLTFNQVIAATYASPLTGDGALIKAGDAALTLTANNSTYAGTVNIAAGSLLLSGATTGSAGILPATPAALGGAIHVATGATLVGGNGAKAGTAGATVTIDNGATLQIGLDATASQTFSILGDLTLSNGSLLNYGNLTNTLLVGGNLSLTGTSTLNFTALTTGSYSIINAATGLSTLNTAWLDINYKGSLLTLGADYNITTNSSGQLWLNILNVPIRPNSVLTWTGAAGDQRWLTSVNWNASASGSNKFFMDGDIINLDGSEGPAPDSAGATTITLDTLATIAGMSVSGTQTYIVTGGGGIVADTTISTLAGTPAATGKLVLGANTAPDASAITSAPFTGILDLTGLAANKFAGVELDAGALRISTAAQLGAPLSKLSFMGATLTTTGTLLIATGANLVFDGAGAATNIFTLADNSAAVFSIEPNSTLTIRGNTTSAAGGAISVGGGSSLSFSARTGASFVFANNIASAGGALSIGGANSSVSFTQALFSGNNATGNGGAIISTGANAIINLTDVSFLDNHAGGNGGAIAATMSAAGNATTFNFTVSAGSTSRFAGNTDSTGANSLYFNYTSAGTVSFNMNIGEGGVLDMLDPLKTAGSTAAAGFKFNKAGDGVWKLAGSSTIAKQGNTATGDVNIAQGELYLYGASEAPVTDPNSGNTYTPAAGRINFYNSYATNGNAAFNFTLSQDAILGIGGGNAINYISAGGTSYTLASSNFTLQAGSILDFKLDNATPESTAMLTINASLLTAAHTNIVTSGTLNPYLNIDFTNIQEVLGTYNLLTLAANGNATLATITDFDSILANATFGDTQMTAADLNALHYAANFGVTGNTLWVSFDLYSATSAILSWNGAAGDTRWKGFNWTPTSAASAPTQPFLDGDIGNLDLADATSNTISLNSSITAAGLYVSGNADYTITGPNSLNTDATTIKTNLAGVAAASGKLILGAAARADGTIDATAAYAGTLTLANTGTDTFVNGIDINTGALVGNAANLGVGPTAALTIAATGTLTFNQTTDATYTAPLNGSGALNKTGSATLTLANANSAFTGPTTITAGALLLDNVALGGDVTAAATTTFGGAGSAGTVTLGDNATLQVGASLATPSVPQTLAINGDLTLGSANTLNYASVADTLHVAGNLTQAGAGTLNLQSLVSGTHDLGNIAALYGTLNYTLNNAALAADSRVTFSTSTDGNDLLATVDMSRVLYWTGTANNGTWALTGADWDNRDAATPVSVFGHGDRVIFDDTGASAPVANIIPQGITASDLYVTAAANYTFTGGALTTDPASVLDGAELGAGAGSGALYKAGSGTLTLSNAANNFKGGINLLGGALAINDYTTAGGVSNVAANATLQIAASGTLRAANLQIADGATLAGAGVLTGAATLNGLVNATIAASNTLTLTGALNGAGGFLKTGAGTLQLNGLAALAATGNSQLDQGTLAISGVDDPSITGTNTAASIKQTLTLNGGNLSLLSVNSTGALAEATANDWTNLTLAQGALAATSTITGGNDIIHIGSGTFAPAIQSAIIPVIDAGDGITVLTNAASNFTGLIRIDSGTLQVTTTAGLSTLTGSGTKVALNGGVLQISAPLTTTRGLEVRAATGNTVAVDDGVATTWSNIYYSGTTTADFTKAGSGTFTLTTALQATSLNVAAGRFIGNAVTSVPNANGAITVAQDAAFELNIAATGTASSMGFFNGHQPFSITTNATIPNSIAGSGTFEITQGKLLLTAQDTTIANINITGALTAVALNNSSGNMTFAPNSKIAISNQARLIIATNNQTLGNVTLQGGATLGFLIDSTSVGSHTYQPGTTIPAHPDEFGVWSQPILVTGVNPIVVPAHIEVYALGFKTANLASLVSADTGNTLSFNTNLALGRADHMTITGETTGAFDVAINNYGDIPAQYNGAIRLIDLPANSDATFNPLTPTIDMGLYKYDVTTVTDNGGMSLQIIGAGAMSNAAALIYSTAALMPLSWFTELDSVSQRLGDLRFETRETAAGLATWLRGYGEKINYNKKVTGSPFSERKLGAEAGLDYKLSGVKSNIYTGAFFGYGQAQRDYSTAGDGTSDTYYAGLYETISTPSGWYLDAVLKANSFKNTFTAIAPSGLRADADFKNTAIGASLEFGKNFDLNYGWYFTPEIQGAIVSVSAQTYQTDTGITVDQDSVRVLQGKLGFEFGRTFETAKHGTIHAYVKAAGLTQRTRGSQLTITLPDSGTPAAYKAAIEGDGLSGGLGLAWLYTKRTQIYFDYETSQAAYYIKPWGLNLGIRYNW